MNRSKILINIIPINLVLSIMAMVYFFNQSSADNKYFFFGESILVSALTLIGSGFYLYSAKQKVDQYFYLVLTVTTWLLLLLMGHHEIFFRMSRALMSLAPLFLYVFIAHFIQLAQTKLYSRLLKWLMLLSFITMISLQTFIFILNYTFFALIFCAIVFIIILSKKNSINQRPFHRKYQKYIIISILLSFVPFIITRSFEPFMTHDWWVRFSHHTFVILPATIGYILLKRSELYLEMDYALTFYLVLFHVTIGAGLTAIMTYGLKISLMNALIILLVLSVAAFLYNFLKKQVEKKQLHLINQAKEGFEKERLDILQSITYDNYLESLSDLMEELIMNTVKVDGLLLIWSEDEKFFIFHQSGIFKDIQIPNCVLSNTCPHSNAIEINEHAYLAFPLTYENIYLGKLILGDKENASHYTEVEIEKLKHLSSTVSEILKTTEILNKNQSRYLKLSQLQYDDQFKLNMMAKSDNLRQSLSHYLHDDVLQTILAVKNLIELIETDQKDLKEIVMTNITQLNDSIRNQMFELYPSTLTDLSLYQSLSVLCDRIQNQVANGQECHLKLTFDDEINVPNALKFPIFRMVKELLQNALKHAKATLIEIRVVYDSSQNLLFVGVEDNGIGIDLNALETAKNNHHVGLFSLKQELQLLNGELNIQRKRTRGTLIQMRIPLNAQPYNF